MHIDYITFEQIRDFWTEQNHFSNVPNKVITRRVGALGPYEPQIENPIIQEYGLFDDEKLIGVTQLYQWDDRSVRYRTMNIIPDYRGDNLFYRFLKSVIVNQYRDIDRLVGWYREVAFPWTIRNGFTPIDGIWHEHDNTRYIMVEKSVPLMLGESDGKFIPFIEV